MVIKNNTYLIGLCPGLNQLKYVTLLTLRLAHIKFLVSGLSYCDYLLSQFMESLNHHKNIQPPGKIWVEE